MPQLTLDLIMNLSYYLQKCVLNIRRVKCTSLYERHVALGRKVLSDFERYLTSVFQITFVSNQEQNNILISIFHQLTPPLFFNGLVRFGAGNVIHQQGTDRISVVRICYGSVSLLTRCIPNLGSYFSLQTFDRLTIRVNLLQTRQLAHFLLFILNNDTFSCKFNSNSHL